jgi:signal transduction histidine kinase
VEKKVASLVPNTSRGDASGPELDNSLHLSDGEDRTLRQGHAGSPDFQSSSEFKNRIPASQFSSLNLSIKTRLPLLIGILLLGIVGTATWASYVGVKDSALDVSRERLRFLTERLASLLQQSFTAMSAKTHAAANDQAIRKYLLSPQSGSRAGVLAVMNQFPPPQDVRVELWDLNRSLVLASPEGSAAMPSAALQAAFDQAGSGPTFSAGGIMGVQGDNVVFPMVAAVKDDGGRPIGFLVRWRKLVGTAEGRQALLDLIGGHAALYLGNHQGEIWTDLVSIAPGPPIDVRTTEELVNYTREGSHSVVALARPIQGTPWFVLVEFPMETALAQANKFLRRMLLIGAALLAIGLAGAWALSRSITRPLHSLTKAAAAITSGNYSRLVRIRRQDELGELAGAFNAMVVRVRDSERDLAHKVQERTAQLQGVNKELESFSYSVSHDLRAPLRHINGFSQALLEDYADSLDDVGKRYLQDLRAATNEMGQLIDDVLRLARVTRSEMRTENVNMSEIAHAIVMTLRRSDAGRIADVNIEADLSTRGDARLLQIMLKNLLDNAWKFTSKCEKTEIIFGKEEQDGGEVFYFIRDNGAGFDMNYADKLFGAFQRLHTAGEFEGTGIGLATVQRVVHRHGGRVWAESAIDKGTTFFFTLADH